MAQPMRRITLIAAAWLVGSSVSAQTTRSVTVPAHSGTIPDTAIVNALRTRLDSLKAADAATNATVATNRAFEVATRARLDSLIAALRQVPLPPPPDTTPLPPPPPPPGGSLVYFRSTWDAATGSSQAALTDGGKWTSILDFDPQGMAQVIPTAGSGRDYPTTNFYRTLNAGFIHWRGIPTPQVGDSIGVRYFYRVITNQTGEGVHGDYFSATVNDGWGGMGVYIGTWQTSTYDFLITADFAQASPYWGPPRLNKNVTYQIEILYIRTGTNAYQFRGRIRNVAGVIVHDTQAFTDYYWFSGATLLNSRTFTLSGAGASRMVGARIGLNGDEGQAVAEYAGYAICKGWCGAYAAGR